MAAARARLGHLARLQSRTDAVERRIYDAAQHRLDVVMTELDQLRPRLDLDADAPDRYQALTLEFGQLHIVAARAHQAIGLSPDDMPSPTVPGAPA